MNKYNKFYFLHIDKTIAKTTGIRMFDPLYKIMEDNGILAIDLNKNHNSHNHWKNFDDKTFIFTTIRNPFERTIAEYIYFSNYDENGIRKHNMGRDEECPNYSEDSIFNWIESKHISNYQSKIISNYNLLDFNKNLSRINLIIKSEQIRTNENYIRNFILSKFNISYNFPYYPEDFENSYISIHKKLNDILIKNTSIENTINKLNEKDWELYNYASEILSLSSLNTE